MFALSSDWLTLRASWPANGRTARCRKTGLAMRKQELNQIVKPIEQLSWPQRRQLIDSLAAQGAGQEVRELVEQRMQYDLGTLLAHLK